VEIRRSLMRALSNTGISVLYQDLDLRIIWSQNVPLAWSDADLLGKTDTDFLPAVDAERMIMSKRAVIARSASDRFELGISGERGLEWYEVWLDLDKADDGRPQGIVTTIRDMTQEKQREQTLRTLLREVSHRSKNLLAIIQSIATQTGRHAATIGGFMERFRGRIQSLAASQDLVTSSNWRGADLRELVSGQVARFSTDPERQIEVTGYNPYLNPNAALHIGLALHELSVNSVSYGALANPQGKVVVHAELVDGSHDDRELAIEWREDSPNATDFVPIKRFGTTALERVVPASLNGRASLEISGGRVNYRLFVPKGSFEPE